MKRAGRSCPLSPFRAGQSHMDEIREFEIASDDFVPRWIPIRSRSDSLVRCLRWPYAIALPAGGGSASEASGGGGLRGPVAPPPPLAFASRSRATLPLQGRVKRAHPRNAFIAAACTRSS